MEDFGKSESSTLLAKATLLGSATSLEGEGEANKKDGAQQRTDTDDESKGTTVVEESGVEPAFAAGGKDKEKKIEEIGGIGGVDDDDKEEKIEGETAAS